MRVFVTLSATGHASTAFPREHKKAAPPVESAAEVFERMLGLLLGDRARATAFFAVLSVFGRCDAALMSAGLTFFLRFDTAAGLLGRSIGGKSSTGKEGGNGQREEGILEFHWCIFLGFKGS